MIDYCLDAEGITLDDVDLIVRNCYILPVPEMEERLVYQDMPGFLPEHERADATKHPLYLSQSDKVVSISHHLAHAYSAFAVSPFEEGVVMIVDGVGSYRSDVMESYPASDAATPLARESESYYKFSGTTLECLKKVWMEPDRGFLSDEFYNMPGLGALYSRASTYIFGDWNKCGELMGLAPYGRREQVKHLLELNDGTLARSALDHRVQAALRHGQRRATGKPARRCGIGRISPGGCRTTPKTCCSPAPAGCAKRPAPRTSASPAASR